MKEQSVQIQAPKKYTSTLDDRNGETYTLCAADTFFGDISGRLGKGDILGDPGH
jgi:hypothetical protein